MANYNSRLRSGRVTTEVFFTPCTHRSFRSGELLNCKNRGQHLRFSWHFGAGLSNTRGSGMGPGCQVPVLCFAVFDTCVCVCASAPVSNPLQDLASCFYTPYTDCKENVYTQNIPKAIKSTYYVLNTQVFELLANPKVQCPQVSILAGQVLQCVLAVVLPLGQAVEMPWDVEVHVLISGKATSQ